MDTSDRSNREDFDQKIDPFNNDEVLKNQPTKTDTVVSLKFVMTTYILN